MCNNQLYKRITLTLFSFLLIILIYSLDYNIGMGLKYMYPNTYFGISSGTNEYGSSGYNPLVWNENGIIESIQAIILFINILILAKLLRIKSNSKIIRNFLVLNFICILYIFFEEISWGQHYLKFDTPNMLVKENSVLFNKQSEFNLHNISNLFNEIPRVMVLIWCCLSIILLRLSKYSRFENIKLIIEPNTNLIYISYTLLILIIPELMIDSLDLYDSSALIIYKDNLFYKYNFYQLSLKILSFNFVRFSELQEILFYYYFLSHSLFLKDRLFNKDNR